MSLNIDKSNTCWIIFSQDLLMIPTQENSEFSLDDLQGELPLPARAYNEHAVQLLPVENSPCYLIDMQQEVFEFDGWRAISLRDALAVLPTLQFQRIAQAWQYALFLRTHQFCGRCGDRMDRVHWEMAMHCSTCQHRSYPRVSPCIIVAIRDGNKILLAQGVRFKEAGFFSTLAGFVESGETLEQAVHREVFEEVGVEVENIEYFDSQPWPFPHSLMVGFLARYKSGNIKIDEREIFSADWFDVNDLPLTPPSVSIAAALISETVKRVNQKK